MTIYAWPGVAVEIVEVKMAPLWVERQPSRIRHHFKEPKRTRLTKEVTPTVGWYAKLKAVDDGRMLYGGKWADVFALKADEGWQEIEVVFSAKASPDTIEKYGRWRESGSEDALKLFELADAKEMAA